MPSVSQSLVYSLIPDKDFLKEQNIHKSAPTMAVARNRNIFLRGVIKGKVWFLNGNCLPLLLFCL